MSNIELIDSHCHLIFENFEKDLEDVVLRLRSKGVKKLIHACCEFTEISKLKKLSHQFKEIYYSVGLHPLEAEKWELSSKSLLIHNKHELIFLRLWNAVLEQLLQDLSQNFQILNDNANL